TDTEARDLPSFAYRGHTGRLTKYANTHADTLRKRDTVGPRTYSSVPHVRQNGASRQSAPEYLPALPLTVCFSAACPMGGSAWLLWLAEGWQKAYHPYVVRSHRTELPRVETPHPGPIYDSDTPWEALKMATKSQRRLLRPCKQRRAYLLFVAVVRTDAAGWDRCKVTCDSAVGM
ncbi:hypothetical protein K523DRAFT_242011, partial [Schizophyllum commune Tattone D]